MIISHNIILSLNKYGLYEANGENFGVNYLINGYGLNNISWWVIKKENKVSLNYMILFVLMRSNLTTILRIWILSTWIKLNQNYKILQNWLITQILI